MKGLIKTLDMMGDTSRIQIKSNLFLSKKSIAMPRIGTNACRDYFISLNQCNDLFLFIVNMAGHIDVVAEMADEALTYKGGRIVRKGDIGKPKPPRIKVLEILKQKHLQFLLEILLVRLVDNYLNYLASLLFEIFINRPETLKSSETINLETVLSHDSINSLVRAVAERKVEELSYKSFKDLREYFKDKFGLKLCKDEDISKIAEAVAVRNLSVHNRCIVNKRFILQTGFDPSWLGECVEFDLEYLQNNAIVFVNSTKLLDISARKKLKLKGVRFKLQTE